MLKRFKINFRWMNFMICITFATSLKMCKPLGIFFSFLLQALSRKPTEAGEEVCDRFMICLRVDLMRMKCFSSWNYLRNMYNENSLDR